MSRMISKARIVVVALLAAALSCGGKGGDCSRANCDVLRNRCALAVSGIPDLQLCQQKAGPMPTGFDEGKYCPAACEAAGSGPVVACIVAEAQVDAISSCSEALVKCKANTGNASPSCAGACASSRANCEALCPSGTFEGCADCSAACGIKEATCVNACPRG